MDWRGYSRWDAQCKTSSCWYWESYLLRLQVIYTKTLKSPWLFCREALNSTQGKGATSLATKEQSCKRGTVGACGAGGIKIIFVVCGFGTTGLSLEEQVHAELVIAQRFSSVYLTEATVGARLPGLLNAGVFCLEEFLRASKSLCPNGSMAERFCESKSLLPLLRSGVWYPLTEPLQIGWLTHWV